MAGDGASLSLLTTEVFPDYLVATHSPHPQVTSHEQVTAVLDGGVDAGLGAYARYLAKAAPPYARRPAWVTDMVMLQIDADAPRYLKADSVELAAFGSVYGPFGSRASARRMLSTLAREHGLCAKVLGLERRRAGDAGAPCFNHQLPRSHGACIGAEPRSVHTERLRELCSRLRPPIPVAWWASGNCA